MSTKTINATYLENEDYQGKSINKNKILEI